MSLLLSTFRRTMCCSQAVSPIAKTWGAPQKTRVPYTPDARGLHPTQLSRWPSRASYSYSIFSSVASDCQSLFMPQWKTPSVGKGSSRGKKQEKAPRKCPLPKSFPDTCTYTLQWVGTEFVFHCGVSLQVWCVATAAASRQGPRGDYYNV